MSQIVPETPAPGDAGQKPEGSGVPVVHPTRPAPSSPFFSRSSDLGDALDSSATAEVSKMTEAGWEPPAAADAWKSWAQGLVEAAGDLAVAEQAWEAE